MFSFLQSKFTIPFFLEAEENLQVETLLNEALEDHRHVELLCKNLPYLKRILLNWGNTVYIPMIWLDLDALDQDPGRFWTVFVYGLQRHYQNLGKSILKGIVDHHAIPSSGAIEEFKREIVGKPFVYLISGCKHIQNSRVVKQLFEISESIGQTGMLVFLNDSENNLIESTNPNFETYSIEDDNCKQELSLKSMPDNHNLLSIMDAWWVDWMKKEGIFQDLDLIDWAVEAGEIQFQSDNLVMPSERLRYFLRDQAKLIDYDLMSKQIEKLAEWLLRKGEWLESFRWYLFIKNFETAGEILEERGLKWLEKDDDPLTLLFWLRELPSVYLDTRPLPSFLAAKAAYKLGLFNHARQYLANVENNLAAMGRFSRNTAHFSSIPITDSGLDAGQLMIMVKQLKEKLESNDAI